ncbi:MAG: hypothetical protein ACJAV5_001195 [Vicingaceae bacterium]|jgi:hypothetical protein
MINDYNLKRCKFKLPIYRLKQQRLKGEFTFGSRKRAHSVNYSIQKNFYNIRRNRYAKDILMNQLAVHCRRLTRLLSSLNISIGQ